MFTHAPRLVQQRPAAPAIYERTPSHVPPLVPRSRALSLRQSPAALPFPTRQNQSTVPQPVPTARPSPEPWVDALKDDVETEYNLILVDELKAQKDSALAAATTVEERAAIQREYDASMADIRVQARLEFQRRVEAERERRLQGNYDGKDALIAEQHSIMQGIVRENMRREVSQSSTAQSSSQAQSQSQSQPGLARPSQPIPIPVQRSRSRNGGPSGSIAARSSVSNTPFPSSSSSSSSRPFPTVRRDSITQHASPRLVPPPVSSPATSVSSISSSSEPSSSYGSSYSKNSEMDRRYEEHQAAVQRREEEVKRKEAAARRSAEEARRREEAAARHEVNARRKNEEATRRIREAELREQQVRAWETRTRKEMELAQKEVEAVRVRSTSQSQTAAIPLLTRVFSKPRTPTGAMTAPNREAKGRTDSHGLLAEHRLLYGTWGRLVSIPPPGAVLVVAFRHAHPSGVYEGIGSAFTHAGRSGRAAGTVWAVWALSHVSLLLILGAEGG
ncbi:hypothetical protein F5888DRAFT_1633141 [Russula emetica]|nr:hypothetical protein F5888DRAFT_1633141 [Russula emetica]